MSESIQLLPSSSSVSADQVIKQAVTEDDDQHLLIDARAKARRQNLPFAGTIDPVAAWQLVQDGVATLVDVRTAEERKFVGQVPDSLHVAWMTGLSMTRNPRFVKEFEIKVKDKSSVVVLLCRSGKRSAAAGEALAKAGFTNIFNVEGGFEGELNEAGQRGSFDGWRFHALPWTQD